ncbi:leucyl-tRNA synthetase [Porphyromonadaceae bacterium COT-184 OH4590]|nr:leucyl-tRNA synthetase [Porphyromonadaceae bacterium COT-184 OH4590]
MEYNFKEIESRWQSQWKQDKTYKVEIDPKKPKFYVLDMFPYPSGAGLHVGHPLGYIASDIYARYKRQKGFNVLHPMGYDAYGLPAEQYAIQTGQHPAVTTEQNIKRYREQLDKIGFSFDWDREIRTCDADYYRWTQWAFVRMFDSYYCNQSQQARPIAELIDCFAKQGNEGLDVAHSVDISFTAQEWNAWNERRQQEVLMNYRMAYLAEIAVNWCEDLGTVLANDEVQDGVSIRGGYPVIQKKMQQWSLRVSAYSQRLLDGLDTIDWSQSIKETQKNWIGRSEGATVTFDIFDPNPSHKDSGANDHSVTVFTTRPDTIYGVTFMVLAPESEYVNIVATSEQKKEVDNYIERTLKRTERERIADKRVTGVFSGSYAINPISKQHIPIYISDYVLAGYGTGAIMAVPAHDSRDYAFAKHFDLPIIPLVEGADVSNESFDVKEGIMINSPVKTTDEGQLILNGLSVKDAIKRANEYIEQTGLGKVKVNYRLRDAIFSRQRYWGEPFPIYYKDGMPYAVEDADLPIRLPDVDKFLPTDAGEPPLGRAKNWTYKGYPLELSTMPGFAGSSAYYLRYEDPNNKDALVSEHANGYWRNVDLYLGGSEHATGHLIYCRFWTKFLFDYGYIKDDEPFAKLLNQGMIQGRSNFVYRIKNTNKFVSYNLKEQYDITEIHVDVNIVDNDVLDLEKFRNWRPEFARAEFVLEEDGKYRCGWAVEKMSKSMYNVVNPDDIVEQYGADTLRLYEMFLGPIEQSKPWDTKGIDGVHRFLKKLWALVYGNDGRLLINDQTPTAEELKTLHKTIKKVAFDIENFSFNTSVSAFMICVNELSAAKCSKRAVLEPLSIILAPFAPHIAEEIYHLCGNTTTVCQAIFPECNEEYLVENSVKYPVSFNGKVRFTIELPADMLPKDVEATALAHTDTAKWLDGKTIKKVIVVPKKIVNIVM